MSKRRGTRKSFDIEMAEAKARCEVALSTLREHFDTAIIFVTRHDGPEGTLQQRVGFGNYFARRGQVQEWLTCVDESDRVSQRPKRDVEDIG